MSYCPGRNCSIRDKCQNYYNDGDVVDFSTEGFGTMSTLNKDGDIVNHMDFYCGDNNSLREYRHFEPLKYYDKHRLSYNHEYNNIGTKFKLTFELQLPYDLYTVFEFPASCSSCPVGFMNAGDCGRNVPFTGEDYKQRPSTCKLKRIPPKEIQQILASSYNMIETVPPVEE